MKENNWQNTRTNSYYGPNTVLGSPRGWVQRALGQKSDLFLHPTSLDPNEITVAGIWRRGQPLPDNPYPAIYRYFRIAEPIRRISAAKPDAFYPVIGMAWAVPHNKIIECYREFAKTADWVWYDLPKPRSKAAQIEERKQNVLDHAELYQLFEQGKTSVEIARSMNVLEQSVHYVYKKWKNGLPPAKNRKPRILVNHDHVADDLRLGTPVDQLVQKYNISKTMIYKIKGKYQIYE